MNNRSKFIPVFYALLIGLFAILSNVFISVGLNIKNKDNVQYQIDSDIDYKVYLLKNDVYDKYYLNKGEKYIASLVDYIKFNFKYDILYSEDINGYYSYNVDTSLVAYEDDINDSLIKRDYKELDNKVVVLDKNHVKNIDINDSVIVDYKKYKEILNDINNKYGVSVYGYLNVRFNLNTELDFSSLDKNINDKKSMEVLIPLSDDTFKIKILNTYDDIDSYYDFSKKTFVNYLYILIGLLCLSISLTFIVMLVRELVFINKEQKNYNKKLKKILKEYEDDIIIVKNFYNKKKYNLIYVDSFDELLDVHKRVLSPISFKEVKKNYKSIFLIIDDDNAWIYRMIREK